MVLCDELWERQIRKQGEEKQQHEREDDRAATRLLFSEPLGNLADDYTKKSVELIRDVCAERIKYNSPEWKKRFKAIYG